MPVTGGGLGCFWVSWGSQFSPGLSGKHWPAGPTERLGWPPPAQALVKKQAPWRGPALTLRAAPTGLWTLGCRDALASCMSEETCRSGPARPAVGGHRRGTGWAGPTRRLAKCRPLRDGAPVLQGER